MREPVLRSILLVDLRSRLPSAALDHRASVPLDVGQTTLPQSYPGPPVAEQGQTIAQDRPSLMAEGQMPNLAVTAAAHRFVIGLAQREQLDDLL